MNKSFFSAWTSIDLSKDDNVKNDEKLGFVKGIVSSEIEDQAGDVIKQDGLDWSYFMDKGYFNWEHQSGPENILGYPTKLVRGESDTSVEGYLFLDRPKAKDAYDMAKILKDVQAPRSIGFSIEGQVIERDKENQNIITKAKILNVSVTAHPCNPDAKLMVKAIAEMEDHMRKTTKASLIKNLEEDEAKKNEAQANMTQTEDEKKAYATVEDAQKTQVEEAQKNDNTEPKADDQGSKENDQEAKKVEEEQAEKAQISKSEDNEDDDMNKAEDSSVGEDSSLGEDDEDSSLGEDEYDEQDSLDFDANSLPDLAAKLNYLTNLVEFLNDKLGLEPQSAHKASYAKKSMQDLSIVSSLDLLSRIQKHFPTMSEDELKPITRKCADVIRKHFVKG
jgi:hypothetical protein